MARPIKDTVEYFPHYVSSGKTMFILEQKYGNDGYAFWFKLLELLASAEGHVYYCDNESDWLFLQAKTHLTEDTMRSILDTLSSVGAIDKDLWCEKKVWSQNLVNNLQPVYANRRRTLPEKPVTTSRNISQDELLQVETCPGGDNYSLPTIVMPQSKVKKSKGSKVEKVKVDCLLLGSVKNVKLTQKEYDKLKVDYPLDAEDIVEFLSLHIAEKGDTSTAQTHIYTIKKWVVDAVRARKEKGWKGYGQPNGTSQPQPEPKPFTYESRIEL